MSDRDGLIDELARMAEEIAQEVRNEQTGGPKK